MTITHRQARRLLGTAAVVGILGERLLDGPGLGLNFTLLVVAWAAAWVMLAREADSPAPRWVIAPVVLCAAGLAWRADPALWAFDLLGIGVSLSLMALPALRRGMRLAEVGVWSLTASAVRTALALPPGPWPPFHQLLRPEPGADRRPSRDFVSAAARGLVLAAPPLLVFGALLVAADARFEQLVSRLFDFPLEAVFRHSLVAAVLAWQAAGLLWVTLAPVPVEGHSGEPRTGWLGAIEVAVILGVLDALFLGFVMVQGSYLFGGERLIATQAGLSYAEYARRGFFQLVAVAGLSLPVLLWLAEAVRSGPGSRLFRPLAGLQIGLLFLILASASHRLLLYIGQFGLTLDRLEASAVLAWIAVTLLWFAATVLRSRPERFLTGGLAAAAIILAALHLTNPSAVVVEVNIRRAASGAPLDLRYLADLGADGVPALVAALPRLPDGDQRFVAQLLCAPPRSPRRALAWNYGRARADAARGRLISTGCGTIPG
jgi:hypothetical protein